MIAQAMKWRKAQKSLLDLFDIEVNEREKPDGDAKKKIESMISMDARMFLYIPSHWLISKQRTSKHLPRPGTRPLRRTSSRSHGCTAGTKASRGSSQTKSRRCPARKQQVMQTRRQRLTLLADIFSGAGGAWYARGMANKDKTKSIPGKLMEVPPGGSTDAFCKPQLNRAAITIEAHNIMVFCDKGLKYATTQEEQKGAITDGTELTKVRSTSRTFFHESLHLEAQRKCF